MNTLSLSGHPTWLKLVRYETSYLHSASIRSAVHDEAFFNAAQGNIDSAAELEATLQAFALPNEGDPNQHAQCRFPARFIWLGKHLDFDRLGIKAVACPNYYKWTLNNTVEAISLIYATGYLGNPASYYGHVLLKLNSAKEKNHTKLLDVSVNYGAIVPNNENPFVYMVKGLLGGYDGGFSHVNYYFHNHNYGENELRDLWEYELELSSDEVELVLAHAWELLGKPYTYYFFRKNCAFRIGEVLEIIEGINIIPSNPVFTLPQTLIQNAGDGMRNGKPLVSRVSYHPSRQARLYNNFGVLDQIEKKAVYTVAAEFGDLNSDEYSALPLESKQQVLDTLLDYYQFAKVAESLPENNIETSYQGILSERYALPPGRRGTVERIPESPGSGRRASLIQLGAVHNERYGDGVSVSLRPAYYDALDSGARQVKNSALSMGEVKLRMYDGDLKIRSLDVIKIESVHSSSTNLEGDRSKAWKLRLGLSQKNLSCTNCLSARFEGDIGQTLALHPKVLVGAYVGGGVQDNRLGSGNLFVKTSAFSHMYINNSLGMRLLAELPAQIDGSGGGENYFSVEARQQISEGIDLRFLYEKNGVAEYSLSLGYYF